MDLTVIVGLFIYWMSYFSVFWLLSSIWTPYFHLSPSLSVYWAFSRPSGLLTFIYPLLSPLLSVYRAFSRPPGLLTFIYPTHRSSCLFFLSSEPSSLIHLESFLSSTLFSRLFSTFIELSLIPYPPGLLPFIYPLLLPLVSIFGAFFSHLPELILYIQSSFPYPSGVFLFIDMDSFSTSTWISLLFIYWSHILSSTWISFLVFNRLSSNHWTSIYEIHSFGSRSAIILFDFF